MTNIPALGSMLYARDVPPFGGDTMFASMYAAYDALSDGLKQTLCGLRAVHSSRHVFGADRPHLKGRIGNPELATQDAIHPVVITHPDSGRKCALRQSRLHAALRRLDGRGIAIRCCAFCISTRRRPEFTCRLRWQNGSLAFWDNRSTWHYALNDYQGAAAVDASDHDRGVSAALIGRAGAAGSQNVPPFTVC